MQLPPKSWERSDLPPSVADQPDPKNPGIYLIALRAHLNRGKTALGDLVDSVTDALPAPRQFLGGSKQPS